MVITNTSRMYKWEPWSPAFLGLPFIASLFIFKSIFRNIAYKHLPLKLYVCIMQMSMDLSKSMDAHEEAIGCQVSSDPIHLISWGRIISDSVAYHVWLNWLVTTLEESACLCLRLWSCGCTLPMPGFWHRSYGSEQRPSCLYSKVSYPLRYPPCSWPSLKLISLKSSPPSGLVEQSVSPSPWVACKFRAYLGRRINFKLSLSQNRKEKEAWGSMPIEEHLFGMCESLSFNPQYCKNKVNKCPTL